MIGGSGIDLNDDPSSRRPYKNITEAVLEN